MQRSLWKGAISFGLVHIPVELFSAEQHNELDFTLLDRRDFAPVGYKRYNKETGEEVEWADIVKGYEYESGHYVVMSDEDLRRANVKATQTIDIQSFVDATELNLTYYEQPYYLAPDKGGDKVYALLREALKRAGKIAIAQIVIRTKQHLAALVPVNDVIVLNTLRYADEIRPTDDYDLPAQNLKRVGISEKELQMALTLVEGMSEEWDPKQFRDSYRDDVLAMVQKKIRLKQTKVITQPEPEEEAQPSSDNVVDLMALLKKSLDGKSAKAASPESDVESDNRQPTSGRTAQPASRPAATNKAKSKSASARQTRATKPTKAATSRRARA